MPEGTPYQGPRSSLACGELLPPQHHRPLQLSKAHSDLTSLRDRLSKGWHSSPRNALRRNLASWCPEPTPVSTNRPPGS